MNSICRDTLLKLMDTVVKKLSGTPFPTDVHGLYSAYCAQKVREGRMARKMVNLLRKLRRGSVEKRVVRACLFSCIRGRELHELMMTHGDLVEEGAGELGGGQNTETLRYANKNGTSGDENRVRSTPDTSGTGASADDHRQIYGSAQSGIGTGLEMSSGMIEMTPSNTGPLVRKCLSGGFQRLQRDSRTDWLTMIASGSLVQDKRRRTHFSDGILVRILSFLFRADNFQLLSWGTKRLVFRGEVHRFPTVIRKTTDEGLWRRFNEELGIGKSVARVGRIVFRSIVSYLTKCQLEARSCIDYYQGTLINENVNLLKDIVAK